MGNKCVQCLGKQKSIHDLDEIQRKVSGLEDIVPTQTDSPAHRHSQAGRGRKGTRGIAKPGDIQQMM